MKIEAQTARVDFEEYLGDTLTMNFGYADENGTLINLASSTLYCYFSTQATPTITTLTASSSNGGIIVGGYPYNIIVKVTATAMSTIFTEGRYNYYLTVTDAFGDINTLVNGLITFKSRGIQ